MKTLEVNAVGPFLVTRALLLNLKLPAKANSLAIVLQVSSVKGSISSNNDEYAQLFRGQYHYTTSKAALNMITRSLAMELREHNIAVVAINPGYVDSDMSSPKGTVKSDVAAADMAGVVDKVSLEDTSKFFSTDPAIPASELPW